MPGYIKCVAMCNQCVYNSPITICKTVLFSGGFFFQNFANLHTHAPSPSRIMCHTHTRNTIICFISDDFSFASTLIPRRRARFAVYVVAIKFALYFFPLSLSVWIYNIWIYNSNNMLVPYTTWRILRIILSMYYIVYFLSTIIPRQWSDRVRRRLADDDTRHVRYDEQ